MIKRVFLIVLDSCGIGELPDAAQYGDAGSNTMRAISRSPKFCADNLISLGLGHIDGIDYLPKCDCLAASTARMAEVSCGKDTTIGHWEIAGIISERALPTYPDGFPQEIIDRFAAETGRAVLCNKPYSGTQVIADYGEEHMLTGALIVYTSADSVFQIAAHEELVPPEQLYEYCRIARKILQGEHGVGRVIARPFVGSAGNFTRTANRHDFSLEPPKDTMLSVLKDAGFDVVAVGKISDIFAGVGVTDAIPTKGNADGMNKSLELLSEDFRGLCFINLVDFDSQYGHRNDIDGYADALAQFDAWLPDFIAGMHDDDVLMITADHGCDPSTESTDHSREYTPLLILSRSLENVQLGTRTTFADIGKTVADMFGIDAPIAGESFYPLIKKQGRE